MAETSNIEWTDATFNPWIGCTKVSPGCDDCYAERSTPARTQKVLWGAGQPRMRTTDANWKKPEAWNRAAISFQMEHGRRRRVFCASLADVFDNEVPDAWRTDLWALIAATPNLDWLLLTKRIGNARKMLPQSWLRTPIYGELPDWPQHLRIGATFCTQEEVNRDMHKLLGLGCPNFGSFEPLLSAIDLTRVQRSALDSDWTYQDNALTGFSSTKCGGHDGKALDWVIVGGESGRAARPMNPRWASSLRDQCESAGVPFLFKQWGEWAPLSPHAPYSPKRAATARVLIETDSRGRQTHGASVDRVGKKEAGRELDGALHDGFPS